MKKMLAATAAALLLTVSFAGCNTAKEPDGYSSKSYVFYCMNTQAELVISDIFTHEREEKFNDLCDEISLTLNSLDGSLSSNVTNSSISKFNAADAGATVEIDEAAYEVLKVAKEVYEETEGYYNPAVYYCVQAYGFNEATDVAAKPEDRIPSDIEIEKFQWLSSFFGDTEIYQAENNRFYAVKPNAVLTLDDVTYTVKVDLGGIGKGYAADKVNALIDGYGFKNGFFSFGTSSIVCKEHYINGLYTLGMNNARGSGSYAQIKIENASLSTSGDYQQFFVLDGVRYCHVFDPTTGKPVQTGIMTVTLIGGTAAEGDALTTAIMAMGFQRAIDFINEKLTGIKAVFSYDNNGSYEIVTNVPDEVTVLSEDYKIINTVSDGKIILGEK